MKSILTLVIAILSVNTNASIRQWVETTQAETGLIITNIEVPKTLALQHDFAKIEAKVDENGNVVVVKSVEKSREEFAQAYENVLRNWKFEPNGKTYWVRIPFVAGN